jgi:hypothetical protein
MYDSALMSFAKINIDVTPKKIATKKGEGFILTCRFNIPGRYSYFINKHNIGNDTIRIGIFNKSGWVKDFFTSLELKQMNNKKQTELKINPQLPNGKYYLRFAINYGINNPTHNSDKIELQVE